MIQNQLVERTISGLHSSLIQQIPHLRYDTPILDIGCGSGAWLERLGNAGFNDLLGIDADTEQFRSEKAVCQRANLDYDDLGLGQRTFGLISAIEIIEHLENPGRLFYHVSQYLDQTGYFLLTTPNIHSLDCRLRFLITGKLKSFDEKGDSTHIYPVLLMALERVLPRYSLYIEKRWSYPTSGSLISRQSTRLISGLLEPFLPNEVPGDTVCFLIRKQGDSTPT